MLMAGASKAFITPPLGVEIAGYSFGPSVGVLDDLEAQALVIKDGNTSIVLLTVDLLTVGHELVTHLRKRVRNELGIVEDGIMVSASHSHSSPTAYPLRQWGRLDAGYLAWLEDTLVGIIWEANRSVREARLGIGTGSVENLSENRRGLREVRDISVPVLRIDDLAGELMAVLLNFACHPVSLHSYRNLLSPDYPGYTRQVVRKVLGQEVVVQFTLGTAGDINPAGYVHQGTSPTRSRQIGEILGCEVAKVALDPMDQPDAILKVSRVFIELPIVPLPPVQELEALQAASVAEANRLRAESQSWERISVEEIKRDWAADALLVVKTGKVSTTVSCEIQAIRLGEAVLLAAPLELFTQTGLEIKRLSPARVTLISSNSNGGLGYLPTLDAYEDNDYTNPEGLAPKIYGIYALASQAEPVFRNETIRLIHSLFA